ncbi:hypothetical protein [Nocardia shimofusensis]|uniref:hypothetical protein n=1 Tax=Nocardia shimofusensis TaxID=228596 RepID=UPI00082CD2E5|nr:hypothetical protein [Nocardia shimofusensis]
MLVDPGQEVRGRIPQLLERFSERRIAPAEIAEEISVMTDDGQQGVREVGRAIVASAEGDVRVWPGWVDRVRVADRLHEDAIEAREHYGDIDYHHLTAVIRDIDTGTSAAKPSCRS